MENLETRVYGKNEVILRQGQWDERLYKVCSGHVDLYIHYGELNQCMVGSLNATQYFGETTVLLGEPSGYTAVARDAVSLQVVPQNCFRDYIRENYIRAIRIMKSMERIRCFMYEFASELSDINKVDAVIAANRVMDRKGYVFQFEETGETQETEEVQGICQGQPEETQQECVKPETLLTEVEHHVDARVGIDILPENIWEVNDLYLSTHKRYPNIVHPEYKQFLFEKEYVCPACGKSFTGKHVFYSKLVGGRKPDFARYDLKVFYKDFEAEWYEMITCRHCYFSTLADMFTESRFETEKYQYGSRVMSNRFEETLTQAYMEIDLDFSVERDLNFVIAQHYMGLVCARGFREYRQIFAHIWTNLSWLYRSVGDDALAQQAESNAKDSYIDVYMNCRLNPKQEQMVCLSIANILCREGKYHEARRWVNNLWGDREMRKTVYANLGRQLLEDIKEKIEEERLEQERLERERQQKEDEAE